MPPTLAPPAPRPGPLTRFVRWAARRRRTALMHLLRGICYGTGTALAGVLGVWIQSRL
ncbi:hypothetical protein [Streptomyces sp. NPDC002994]|uniref:hypothetical protein n=1 Tax=Streptomyces sp. NPDC002994 TaxID=3154441 RepID=UPI0033B1B05A